MTAVLRSCHWADRVTCDKGFPEIVALQSNRHENGRKCKMQTKYDDDDYHMYGGSIHY